MRYLALASVLLACRGPATPRPRRVLVDHLSIGDKVPLFADERAHLETEIRARLARQSGMAPLDAHEFDALRAGYDPRSDPSWDHYLATRAPDAWIVRINASCGPTFDGYSCGLEDVNARTQGGVTEKHAGEITAWIQASGQLLAARPMHAAPTRAPAPSPPCRDRAMIERPGEGEPIRITSYGEWPVGCTSVADVMTSVRPTLVGCALTGRGLLEIGPDGHITRCEAVDACTCPAVRAAVFPTARAARRVIIE